MPGIGTVAAFLLLLVFWGFSLQTLLQKHPRITPKMYHSFSDALLPFAIITPILIVFGCEVWVGFFGGR